jgi:hypothetical protein
MANRSARNEAPFRVPVSCLAEFMSSSGRSAEALLRPYKFNKRGEGFARSSYYQYALAAIRNHHNTGNDPKVFPAAILELRKKADDTDRQWQRVKLEKNIAALEAYQRIYKDRKFQILPCHRIEYRIGQVTFTAQPDLWVEENGTELLLKIGIARKKASYIDIVLTVMRKAAIDSGYRRVRARNVIYLNISTGKEMFCIGKLTRFNRSFRAIASEIARAWPTVNSTPRDESPRAGQSPPS